MIIPNSKLRGGVLALVGSILTIHAASAAVTNHNNGDLYIGFRASGGQGSDVSYLINIGSNTTYRDAEAGSSFSVSVGNIAADLASEYGENWAERADLSWGVFGAVSGTNSTVFASRERIELELSNPWPALSFGNRNTTSSQIVSVTTAYHNKQSTTNSNVAVWQQNSGGAASYNFQVASGATDFGSVSQWGSIEGSVANATEGSVLDLYRLFGPTSGAGSVQLLGSFSLSNDGTLTFTAAAVPEPSVALLGGLGVVFALTRRQRRANA